MKQKLSCKKKAPPTEVISTETMSEVRHKRSIAKNTLPAKVTSTDRQDMHKVVTDSSSDSLLLSNSNNNNKKYHVYNLHDTGGKQTYRRGQSRLNRYSRYKGFGARKDIHRLDKHFMNKILSNKRRLPHKHYGTCRILPYGPLCSSDSLDDSDSIYLIQSNRDILYSILRRLATRRRGPSSSTKFLSSIRHLRDSDSSDDTESTDVRYSSQDIRYKLRSRQLTHRGHILGKKRRAYKRMARLIKWVEMVAAAWVMSLNQRSGPYKQRSINRHTKGGDRSTRGDSSDLSYRHKGKPSKKSTRSRGTPKKSTKIKRTGHRKLDTKHKLPLRKLTMAARKSDKYMELERGIKSKALLRQKLRTELSQHKPSGKKAEVPDLSELKLFQILMESLPVSSSYTSSVGSSTDSVISHVKEEKSKKLKRQKVDLSEGQKSKSKKAEVSKKQKSKKSEKTDGKKSKKSRRHKADLFEEPKSEKAKSHKEQKSKKSERQKRDLTEEQKPKKSRKHKAEKHIPKKSKSEKAKKSERQKEDLTDKHTSKKSRRHKTDLSKKSIPKKSKSEKAKKSERQKEVLTDKHTSKKSKRHKTDLFEKQKSKSEKVKSRKEQKSEKSERQKRDLNEEQKSKKSRRHKVDLMEERKHKSEKAKLSKNKKSKKLERQKEDLSEEQTAKKSKKSRYEKAIYQKTQSPGPSALSSPWRPVAPLAGQSAPPFRSSPRPDPWSKQHR